MRSIVFALLLVTVACDGCRKSVPVDQIEELAYPSCGEGPLPPGEVLLSGQVQAGPNMRPREVAEHYELRRRGCIYVLTARQRWPHGVADLEVVYDEDWRPLRVWKRMYPLDGRGATLLDRADIRRYELRTSPATIRWRRADGSVELRALRGERPVVVVSSGRASLLPWILSEGLEVGAFAIGPALDIRTEWDEIDEATLHRGEDRFEPSVGALVHVHQLYGSQVVYTDDAGHLLGDMAGLIPADQAVGEPIRVPDAPMDTVNTP